MLLTIEVIRHKIKHKIAKGFTLLQKGQNGSKLLKKVKTGFTLVELLVVLGILAVMLALVLIAINPLEMLNKTQDVAVQQVTKDFASATKYFYATEKTTPWAKSTSCRDELATKDTVSQMPSCVQELTKGGDLQTKAVNSDEAKDIFMTECSGSVALCYKPKSSTYRNDSNAKYGRNGALNPECPGGDNCYTCEFTTNEAQECFEIMSPNAEIASATFSDPEEPMPIVERPSISVCSDPQDGAASCMSDLVTDSKGTPLTTLATPNGLSPEQMHKAYNLPCTPGANTIDWQCDTPTIFGPKTVAVILAFHSPTIEADLAVYSQTFGLPPCTKANGCLTIVNQNGQTSPLPSGRDSTWAVEAAMDVQIAHAICQTCKILLVEAEDNYFTNLGAATSRAAQMGATVISNSYGNYEYPSYAQYESFYDHPGIAVTASSGDWGYGTIFPASHSKVIGVGGTELSLFPDNSYAGEKTWNGAGSGCSATRLAGTYQTSLPNWSAVGCGTKKSVSDVSAVASPYTGAAIYDSGNGFGSSGWKIIGGTSLSSPLYAAVVALQGGIPSGTDGSAFPYTQQNKFRDVNIGSNGSCGGMLKCMAGVGYDGPTGLGTPNLLPSGEVVPTVIYTPTPIRPSEPPTPTTPVTPTLAPRPVPPPTNQQVWIGSGWGIYRFTTEGIVAPNVVPRTAHGLAVVGQEVWATDFLRNIIYRYNFDGTQTKPAITNANLKKPVLPNCCRISSVGCKFKCRKSPK
jgi:prepilin-type N-terminal cleavage/methylation domain-containing protein